MFIHNCGFEVKSCCSFNKISFFRSTVEYSPIEIPSVFKDVSFSETKTMLF